MLDGKICAWFRLYTYSHLYICHLKYDNTTTILKYVLQVRVDYSSQSLRIYAFSQVLQPLFLTITDCFHKS